MGKPLEQYRRMRRFDATPEPSGDEPVEPQGDSFTIQRHAASHLHYDFRLELDGVLKSWAVPKGPSLDPAVKRLAVEVEDHPVAYGTFEGEIPKGQYGGGTVVLWDRGRWKPVGDPREGLRKGHLKFELDGRKLKGRWALIRTRRPGASKPQWLLIKERDEHARPADEYDVAEARPESVATGRKAGRPKVWRSHRASRTSRSARVRRRSRVAADLPSGEEPMPALIEPQLCTLVERPPSAEGYVHELKLDGYRIVARVEAGQARLYTRRGKDWTASFPRVAKALETLGADALYDGEIVSLDERGRPSFQALQNAMKNPGRPLVFYVFDLLHLNGKDLRETPLLERKSALAALLEGAADPLRYCDHLEGGGDEFYEQACKLGLEGIVSKKADGPYLSGRTKQWMKVKCLRRQEFVIGGFTEPQGARSGFGALLVGYFEKDGRLTFVGRVGTGFDDKLLRDLHGRLKDIAADAPPFANPPKGAAARGVTWTEPKLVAEVAYSEMTDDGILRHPRFEGLRADKPAAEVVGFETPKPTKKVEKAAEKDAAAAPERPFGGIVISNPDKVLYPELGLTKKELAEYYEAVAPLALAHAARRPLALVRCPAGRQRHCFFQKHVGDTFPDCVKPVAITEKTEERTYLYIEDLCGLEALVQMGVLEYHPWGSTVDDLERPDVLTIDLDPGPGLSWGDVVAAAFEVKERLESAGLESFVKTTGGKGLHVVAPVEPSLGWDDFKAAAKRLAEALAREHPQKYTSKIVKSARGGRIFVDYLRNGRGATAVAAYSTRAREGATVSTPLAWEELTPKLDPKTLNVKTVPRRLEKRGDPWTRYAKVRQKLDKEASWRD